MIQRQLGHVSLGTTAMYLQGIDTEEIIATVHSRRVPDDVRDRRAPALTNGGSARRSRSLPLPRAKRAPGKTGSARP